MTDIRLTVRGLAVDYPTARVVDNVSFTLGNERLALVGESGSGKSMTARALMGPVRKPGVVSAERLEVLGRDVLTLSARGWRELRGNDIAMVLQDPRYALNPVQSIQTQLEEALTLHQRLSRRARAEAVKDAIAAVGLDLPVLSRYPGELSGGMGQRGMIALALLNNPKVLIADEPTSALDARLRNQILELLVEQCAQRQMAMLLISHDLPLVAAHCDRVLVMYRGRQVDEMPARALPSATHPYTRTLWTCRPSAHTYGQMLPTLDRTRGLYGDSPWRSLIFRIYRLHSARRRRSPPPVSVSTPGNLQPDRRLGLRQIDDFARAGRIAARMARQRGSARPGHYAGRPLSGRSAAQRADGVSGSVRLAASQPYPVAHPGGAAADPRHPRRCPASNHRP